MSIHVFELTFTFQYVQVIITSEKNKLNVFTYIFTRNFKVERKTKNTLFCEIHNKLFSTKVCDTRSDPIIY